MGSFEILKLGPIGAPELVRMEANTSPCPTRWSPHATRKRLAPTLVTTGLACSVNVESSFRRRLGVILRPIESRVAP
jgi:hypothetical protein